MRVVATAALVLLSMSGATSAACPPPDPEVSEAIQQLSADGTGMEVLDRLLQKPKAAACQLVAELKLVDERFVSPRIEDQHPAAIRVAWSIRALRYITRCQDFGGSTKEKFPSGEFLPRFDLLNDRKNFLLQYDRDHMPFFVTWMSRGVFFFAGRDAQSEIIAHWREWLGDLDQFEFGPCEDLNDWY
jgi:hypothetical protein